jgi:transposase
MNERERRRSGVLDRVKSEDLTQVEAAEILGLSYRQTKRLYRRFLKLGGEGLVHGHVGRPSNHAKEAKFRRRVLALVGKHYGGEPGERFGPTLAAEHLAEDHGVAVDAETLRRWMLEEGLWTRERKRKQYRQRRLRRAHFGELVQMDGSFEDWLETRGPRGCLIHMVDDATSTSLATFTSEETTWGVADTLRIWVEKYGIPRALYVDWKTVYLVKPTERQKQESIVPITQVGRMCAKLGIEIIGANSAQAKGRVERGHGTHQDRLIKKMRLKKIATYEKANAFLAGGYLQQHNHKYAVTAREKADFHLAVGARLDLNQIFCLEKDRKVSNDWVVQYGTRWLQIEAEQKRRVMAGSVVVVREHRDGALSLVQGGVVLRWHELGERPKAAAPGIQRRVVRRPKPAPDHPWRKPIQAAQGRGAESADASAAGD